jgi:hypothetical protein
VKGGGGGYVVFGWKLTKKWILEQRNGLDEMDHDSIAVVAIIQQQDEGKKREIVPW